MKETGSITNICKMNEIIIIIFSILIYLVGIDDDDHVDTIISFSV